jgi:hypothetical protein
VLALIGFAINWIVSLIFPHPSVAPTNDPTEMLANVYRGARIQLAVGLVLGAILGCLGAVASVVVYYRLRSAKEQVDIGKIVAVFT